MLNLVLFFWTNFRKMQLVLVGVSVWASGNEYRIKVKIGRVDRMRRHLTHFIPMLTLSTKISVFLHHIWNPVSWFATLVSTWTARILKTNLNGNSQIKCINNFHTQAQSLVFTHSHKKVKNECTCKTPKINLWAYIFQRVFLDSFTFFLFIITYTSTNYTKNKK